MQESTANKVSDGTESIVPTTHVKRPIFLKLFWAFVFLSFFITVMNLLLVIYTFHDLFSTLGTGEIIDKLFNNIIFLILFVAIPCILLSVLTSSSIAKPIREISKSLKELAGGNMGVEIKMQRKDEFGNLTILFNNMISQMRQTKERNEEISKTKSKFITVASHQLRTPASGVRWGLDALLSEGMGKLTPEQKNIVEQCISKNNETIKNLDDFLNVSQIEEKSFPYEFQEINISAKLEEVIDSFAIETKLKERKIVFENELDKNTKIIADPKRLTVVWNNIIENAVKYGTAKTAIEIMMKKEDAHILIQISNYGLEIMKEDMDKLFTQFFRAENAIKLKPDGIGLGLYVCKNIIEHHKGNITVASMNGKTTFSIYLPIRAELIAEKSKTEEFLENI